MLLNRFNDKKKFKKKKKYIYIYIKLPLLEFSTGDNNFLIKQTVQG